MASFIAYFMSAVTLLIAIIALVATVVKTDELSITQTRRLVAGFVVFGFLAWLFAYLGGI